MSCTLQPRFHRDEGVTQQNPPLSLIVYHFSTLRRSERSSRGIGLIKSTVTPFLARGLNETPIFRSLLPDYKDKIKEIVMLLRSRGFPCLNTALRVFTCIPGGRYFAECVTPSPPPPPPHPKKRARDQNKVTASGVDKAKNYLHMSRKFFGFARKTIVKWLRTGEIE